MAALCQASLLVPFVQHHLSLHVSVLYFDNFHNTSSIFIIIIFVIVICDNR